MVHIHSLHIANMNNVSKIIHRNCNLFEGSKPYDSLRILDCHNFERIFSLNNKLFEKTCRVDYF
ncbi:MAG: hypothetical protein A4E55_02461 [Pelotomaculum sp. PtaU1.Bin035]|nr:MAG: hypothetical protein A4E55_02461 [Pelotomaculum sp. PtaU1.Bin035]